VLIKTELEDSHFVKEHGDLVACIIQKVLCSQKIPDTTQRLQIFYSRCSTKDKICNLIINNESYKNIISRVLVDHLNLETKSRHYPYDIGWIKKSSCIKITDLYYVPISIGKFYQDFVACDVIDRGKCHIFWEDHSNMTLTLPTMEERIYMYSLGRTKNFLETNSTGYKIHKEKSAFTCIPMKSK